MADRKVLRRVSSLTSSIAAEGENEELAILAHLHSLSQHACLMHRQVTADPEHQHQKHPPIDPAKQKEQLAQMERRFESLARRASQLSRRSLLEAKASFLASHKEEDKSPEEEGNEAEEELPASRVRHSSVKLHSLSAFIERDSLIRRVDQQLSELRQQIEIQTDRRSGSSVGSGSITSVHSNGVSNGMSNGNSKRISGSSNGKIPGVVASKHVCADSGESGGRGGGCSCSRSFPRSASHHVRHRRAWCFAYFALFGSIILVSFVFAFK